MADPDSELASKLQFRRAARGADLELLAGRQGQLRGRPGRRGRRRRRCTRRSSTMARQSRQFLIRVVRYLAAEAGIRQFLDIGTGLPTMQNTHEVAQGVAPERRIVYVDNDPMVLVHARALLVNTTAEGVDHLRRRRLPRPGADPRRGGEGARLHRADRRHVHGRARLRAGPRRGALDRRAGDGRRPVRQLPGAVGRHRHQPGRGRGRREAGRERRRPVHPAQPGRARPAASTAWSWSSPAWCRSRSGARTTRQPSDSTPTARWPASRD